MIEWEDVIDSVQLDQALDNLGVNVTSIVRGEHWASCVLPTHPSADHTPSFSINEDTLLWNCFTCNEGGLLPSLVALTLGLESDADEGGLTAFQKGVEWLLPYSDADVNDDAQWQTQLERYLDRLEEKPKRVRAVRLPVFNPHVFDDLEYCPVRLLKKWHIKSVDTVEQWGIRYDPERERIKGDKEYVGAAIIVPHYFEGELVGYQERWIDPDRPKWLPKITNSDDFPKAQTLFGWDRAIKEVAECGLPVIVVEAALTAIRLAEIDYTAVATFGAGVRAEQIKLMGSLWGGVMLTEDDDPAYQNKKGEWVMGAGKKAVAENVDALATSIPVWKIPPVGEEKADLADVDDERAIALIKRKKAVFSLQAEPNKREKRAGV